MLSVSVVQIINMIANFLRFAVSKPFGRYSDQKSFSAGMELAFMIAACGFFINSFTTNKTWFLIIVFTILYHVSFAGIIQNSFNITYSFAKSEYVSYAISIKCSIAGICGFLSSLLGSRILLFIQSRGLTIFGINI